MTASTWPRPKPYDRSYRQSLIAQPLLAAALFLLPVQAVPGVGRLPVPLSSILIALGVLEGAAILLSTGALRFGPERPVRRTLVVFFLYCCVSAVYGAFHLAALNSYILPLVTGDVSYTSVVVQRLLQLIVAFGALEVTRTSNVSMLDLTRYWLNGLVFFLPLHLLSFLFLDEIGGRAGTFVEGNFGGLYYALSLFLALGYRASRGGRGGFIYIASAITGLLLARSSVSFVAVPIGLIALQMLSGRSGWRHRVKQLIWLCAIVGIVSILIATGNDFGFSAKLFTEEVTPDSFSRIDRLLTIATAFQLALESPLIGHGLQSFGFLANAYIDGGPFEMVYDWSFRRIPNNIYLEIISELGLIGFTIFMFLIGRMYVFLKKRNDILGKVFVSGLVTILVYWMAFPTYSLVYIWFFFGLGLRMEHIAGNGYRRRVGR